MPPRRYAPLFVLFSSYLGACGAADAKRPNASPSPSASAPPSAAEAPPTREESCGRVESSLKSDLSQNADAPAIQRELDNHARTLQALTIADEELAAAVDQLAGVLARGAKALANTDPAVPPFETLGKLPGFAEQTRDARARVADLCPNTRMGRIRQCNRLVEVINEAQKPVANLRAGQDAEAFTRLAEELESVANQVEATELADDELVGFRAQYAKMSRELAEAARRASATLEQEDMKKTTEAIKAMSSFGPRENELVDAINVYCTGSP